MTEQKNQAFNTDFKYAIVSGWLIIPAIHALFTMLGSILIVFLGQPQNLEGAGLVTYIFSLVMILYLAFTAYAWIKRKRVLPLLMIVFYSLQTLESFTFVIAGFAEEYFYLLVNVIFIVYFIRSKRVKATFIQ